MEIKKEETKWSYKKPMLIGTTTKFQACIKQAVKKCRILQHFRIFKKELHSEDSIESKPNDIITLKEDNFFKKIDQFKRDAEKKRTPTEKQMKNKTILNQLH